MRFSKELANSLTCYLTVTDVAGNKIYDFADNTWKALSAPPTTPGSACGTATLGTKTVYSADLSLSLLSAHLTGLSGSPVGMTPREICVTMYAQAGGSPAPSTDTFEVCWFLRLIGGESVPDDPARCPFSVEVTVNLNNSSGTSAHLTAELISNGKTVDLATLDPAATCAIAVTQDATTTGGARVAQFSLSTGTIGAPNAANRFEAEQASPALAANRNFTAVATITAGGVAYVGRCKFATF